MSANLRRSVAIPFACAVVFVTGSCVSASRSTPTASVALVVSRLVTAVNSADLDGFMGLFAPQASAFLPSAANPSTLTGYAQIKAGVSEALATPPRNPMAIRDLLITAERTMAVASFEIGNPIVHSRRTLVLRKISGEWKIVHLHGSNLRAESN
jgi:ketosteroid isomerase-like protein